MNMNANRTVTAVFNAATYTITAKSGACGSISPAGVVTVKRGSDVTLTMIPNTRYRMTNVTVNGAAALADLS
jgi:Divergent InlB B-repeat domain